MIPVWYALLTIFLSICTAAQDTSNGAAKQTESSTSSVLSQYWHKVDAGPFSILAPSGWRFRQQSGVDSYVGEFLGDGMVLNFDFGQYSGELHGKKKPQYIIVKKRIDGRAAKLVRPRTPGDGMTGVYISVDRHDALCLWGKDLSREQQQLALSIFETIRFGGPTPASVVLPPPPPPPPN